MGGVGAQVQEWEVGRKCSLQKRREQWWQGMGRKSRLLQVSSLQWVPTSILALQYHHCITPTLTSLALQATTLVHLLNPP